VDGEKLLLARLALGGGRLVRHAHQRVACIGKSPCGCGGTREQAHVCDLQRGLGRAGDRIGDGGVEDAVAVEEDSRSARRDLLRAGARTHRQRTSLTRRGLGASHEAPRLSRM
jgi:hypothetical protein